MVKAIGFKRALAGVGQFERLPVLDGPALERAPAAAVLVVGVELLGGRARILLGEEIKDQAQLFDVEAGVEAAVGHHDDASISLTSASAWLSALPYCERSVSP